MLRCFLLDVLRVVVNMYYIFVIFVFIVIIESKVELYQGFGLSLKMFLKNFSKE